MPGPEVRFGVLGIDTDDVPTAAGTKLDLLPFTPGLVGGQCIGVDPKYLTHKAQEVGHHPEVIMEGLRINHSTSPHVAAAGEAKAEYGLSLLRLNEPLTAGVVGRSAVAGVGTVLDGARPEVNALWSRLAVAGRA